ncbi:MAG: phytanoyl-CoA dioxygenase family protein [Chloroflexota bacterium]
MIDQRDIEAFQQDGAVCLRQVFDQAWLHKLEEGIRQNQADPSPNSESLRATADSGAFYNDYCTWQRIPAFREFVYDSPAAEIVGRLMQSQQAIFYHEHILIKEPGTLKKTPWHHDQPYYPIDGSHMCSIWLPIDPVPLESSLQFVKGSHRWGRWYVPRKFATAQNYQFKTDSAIESDTIFETVPDVDNDPDSYEICSWELEPGDCIVFHGLALHGAAEHTALDTARRVFSARWVGENARFADRPWDISPPITGGLKAGDPMVCDTFPLIWSGDN